MMGQEINLLKSFPKAKRDVTKRQEQKTEKERLIARQFGQEFFDGDRKNGYGGYHYHPRFWQQVVKDFQNYYRLTKDHSILDIGCAKGFLLYDFVSLIPGIQVQGIDISSYAIQNAHPDIKSKVQTADARDLPYLNDSFDLVISINTIHNFEGDDLVKALKEIERVSKKHSFIMVDGYKTAKEKALLHNWNLTAKSILHGSEWEQLFSEVSFSGDYFWFIP